MHNNQKIIEIIKNRRTELNLSLSEVARRMEIPKSTLSRYEKLERQFPLNQIPNIASVLDLTPEYILGLSNQVETNSTLSEIIKVASQLNEEYQKVTLNTVLNLLEKQKEILKK